MYIFEQSVHTLAAVKVVKMTIFRAFTDDNFIKMTFPFSVFYQIMHLHHSIIVHCNATIDKKSTDIYDSMIYAAP